MNDGFLMMKMLVWYVFIGTIISLVLFLVCREIVCWYWKINRGIELLEKIHQELEKMSNSKIEKNIQEAKMENNT